MKKELQQLYNIYIAKNGVSVKIWQKLRNIYRAAKQYNAIYSDLAKIVTDNN